LTAGRGLMLKAVMRCGQCADLAFANFPVAILSWMVAQIFLGCAAYAEAMYPSIAYLPENEDAERREPSQNGPPARGKSPGLALDPRELSRFAIDDGGARSSLPIAGRTQSMVARSGEIARILRLDVMRQAPSGRLVSITTTVTAWLSRRRQLRGRRQAIVELRNRDRRALRGAGFSRYGIE
jgi:hypothetical protein